MDNEKWYQNLRYDDNVPALMLKYLETIVFKSRNMCVPLVPHPLPFVALLPVCFTLYVDLAAGSLLRSQRQLPRKIPHLPAPPTTHHTRWPRTSYVMKTPLPVPLYASNTLEMTFFFIREMCDFVIY